jgi:hypothetical protein
VGEDGMIRNLTPHPVTILDGDRRVAVIPVDGAVAWARMVVRPAGAAPVGRVGEALVPLTRSAYSTPVDLPGPVAGVWLLVSLVTARAAELAGRAVDDLLVPHDIVRDDAGREVGYRSLSVFEPSRLTVDWLDTERRRRGTVARWAPGETSGFITDIAGRRWFVARDSLPAGMDSVPPATEVTFTGRLAAAPGSTCPEARSVRVEAAPGLARP